jgi:hypothetical protein
MTARLLGDDPAHLRGTGEVDPARRRWAINSSTTSAASDGALVIRLITPGGRPASYTPATAAWVRGQISEALSTTVLPNASGIATARVASITGAFQGANATSRLPHAHRQLARHV